MSSMKITSLKYNNLGKVQRTFIKDKKRKILFIDIYLSYKRKEKAQNIQVLYNS